MRLRDGMAGAKLLFLHRDHRACAFDRALHLVPACAHDHHLTLRRQLGRARQQMQQHRPPGDRVQHLVQR